MPKNADNFAHYSNAVLLDLVARFDGTRQQWCASEARCELAKRNA